MDSEWKVTTETLTPEHPITKTINGLSSWVQKKGDLYQATGVDRDGKRFKRQGTWDHINGINVWKGTKWLVRNGKRYKIQEFYN